MSTEAIIEVLSHNLAGRLRGQLEETIQAGDPLGVVQGRRRR
jgi:hypothetical protein